MGMQVPLRIIVAELAKSFVNVAVVDVDGMPVSVVSRISENQGIYCLSFEALINGQTVHVAIKLGSGEDGLRKAHQALRDEFLLRNGALALIEETFQVTYEEPEEAEENGVEEIEEELRVEHIDAD